MRGMDFRLFILEGVILTCVLFLSRAIRLQHDNAALLREIQATIGKTQGEPTETLSASDLDGACNR